MVNDFCPLTIAAKLLTLSCIMLWNGQTYFKNPAVFTPQDFQSMFGHFTTLCMTGLISDVSGGSAHLSAGIYQTFPSYYKSITSGVERLTMFQVINRNTQIDRHGAMLSHSMPVLQSHGNQSINVQCNWINWFLYDEDREHKLHNIELL